MMNPPPFFREREGEIPLFSFAFAREQGAFLSANRLLLGPKASLLALQEAQRLLGETLPTIRHLDAEAFAKLLGDTYATDDLQIAADAATAANLESLAESSADILDDNNAAPVIRLINAIVARAAEEGASDIHLEPTDTGMQVRLRRDGVMEEALSIPAAVAPMLVSRVKVMARLDIAEKRLPQDGRISLDAAGHRLDVRVSTLPARGGERVVLRLLDQEAVSLDMSSLGLDPVTLAALGEALESPNGILLVTGPTGAGKTTTLYAALRTLTDGRRNILTIEDPVEYAVPGVGQTQVDTRVGLTFAQGLRAILRQDPDIVMVGEIRDRETAEIAVQAALTGHLVLSTVHANSAAGAITRLRDFGIESFLIAATLRAVIAQRLLRLVCPHCASEEALVAPLARRLQLPEGLPVAKANGCPRCHHTGYEKRQGVFEIITASREVRQLINDAASEGIIEEKALQQSLQEAARAAVRAKRTTPTEALPLFGGTFGEGTP